MGSLVDWMCGDVWRTWMGGLVEERVFPTYVNVVLVVSAEDLCAFLVLPNHLAGLWNGKVGGWVVRLIDWLRCLEVWEEEEMAWA